MPRSSATFDDPTPLNGPRIDVNARIGWLLRTTRVAAGLTLRQVTATMAEHGFDLSVASVSRIESEGRRSEQVLRGYALATGLPEHQLALMVDDLCRSFSYGPPRPASEPMTLQQYDACFEAVSASDPNGDDWWRFAEANLAGTGFGLPAPLLAPQVARLATELQRSRGFARLSRWASLVHLHLDRYSDVVHGALLPLVFEPDGQRPDDLLGVLTERPSPATLTLVTGLLAHPSRPMVQLASYNIQSLLVMGGTSLQTWTESLPALRAGWAAARGDHERLVIMTVLTQALPRPLQEELAGVATPVPVPDPVPGDWTRSRRNSHYGYAVEVAATLTEHRGLGEDPMLARLLFEAFFEPRGVRKSVASWMVALSVYGPDAARLLPQVWDSGPEPGCRSAVARLGAACQRGTELPDVGVLLESPEDADFHHAMAYHAQGGVRLPQAAVERGLAGDEATVRRTMYALGMAGDPRLEALATDADQPDAVRAAAGWWRGRGARIAY